jgi:cysteine-rich repeat protein
LAELCGDGTQQSGEECDDGNLMDGDGCRSDCTVEDCGDGILDPQEACDDGNTVDGDTCSGDCMMVIPEPAGPFLLLVGAAVLLAARSRRAMAR